MKKLDERSVVFPAGVLETFGASTPRKARPALPAKLTELGALAQPLRACERSCIP